MEMALGRRSRPCVSSQTDQHAIGCRKSYSGSQTSAPPTLTHRHGPPPRPSRDHMSFVARSALFKVFRFGSFDEFAVSISLPSYAKQLRALSASPRTTAGARPPVDVRPRTRDVVGSGVAQQFPGAWDSYTQKVPWAKLPAYTPPTQTAVIARSRGDRDWKEWHSQS